MKISVHANMRMRERTPWNHKQRRNLFKEALTKGKNIQDIKDERIRKFVKSKQHNCKTKLYLDYLFIYSKNNKQLYTMYHLPDEFLNIERYRS